MKRSVALLSVLLAIILSGTALAAPPQLINYQGYLTNDAGAPVSANPDITFRIYDADTGGASLWSETQAVAVTNGIYSVQLGLTNGFPADLFNTQPLYLGIQISPSAEMSPRQMLTHVPYAFRAEQANTAQQANTITGSLNLPANGLTVGTNQLVVSDGKVGINTSSPAADLQTVGQSGVLFAGNFDYLVPTTTPISGAGSRLMWLPEKAAFRVGYVDGTQWDASNIGLGSVAMGLYTAANGYSSTALGFQTLATGDWSTAMGNGSTASGEVAVSMGEGTIASGYSATAMGGGSVASGSFSTAMGVLTEAPSLGETAVGFLNTTYTPLGGAGTWNAEDRLFVIGNGQLGVRSDALVLLKNGNLGLGTSTPTVRLDVNGTIRATSLDLPSNGLTVGTNQFVVSGGKVGINTVSPTADLQTTGQNGVVFGGSLDMLGTTPLPVSGAGSRLMWLPEKAAFRAGWVSGTQWDASNVGNYSVGLGQGVKANGQMATAIGSGTTASATIATAMGSQTIASGEVSTAMGVETTASGSRSTAMGEGTQALSRSETAVGSYNTSYSPLGGSLTWNAADRLFVIGNGRYGAPSDAMVVMKNGNVGIGTSDPIAPLDTASLIRVLGKPGGVWPSKGEGLELAYNTTDHSGYIQSYDRYASEWHDLNINAATVYIGANMHVWGTLSKNAGAFRIDHPLDPANKYLYHSFVESPDMMNIYNGNITTDEQGYATVVLPEWFETLNRDFKYQLTVIDESDNAEFAQAKVIRGISNNRFSIRSSAPHTTISWQVTGVRQDAYAEAHRIQVEEIKPENEKGKCQYSGACKQ